MNKIRRYSWDNAKDGTTCYAPNVDINAKRPHGCVVIASKYPEYDIMYNNDILGCNCLRGECRVDESISYAGIMSQVGAIEQPVCKRNLRTQIRMGRLTRSYRY